MTNEKKNTIISCLIYAIIAGLINLLIFTIFDLDKITLDVAKKSFWISYSFLMLAFVMQFATIILFNSKNKGESVFMGIPMAKINIIYFAVELVVSLVFIILAQYNVNVPVVVVVVLQVVLFGIYLIILLKTLFAKNHIQSVDQNIRKNVGSFRDMTSDLLTYAEMSNNSQVKKAIQLLAEDIKYSDPMTNEIVAELDTRIKDNIVAIGASVDDSDAEELLALIKKTKILVMQRSNRLKDHK